MCGIIGFYSPDAHCCKNDLISMTATLSHRGPDDRGIWVEEAKGVGLGHTRLSILDLSPLGHQPMQSSCGRYVVAYNGEIYNHAELRKDLGGYPFRSSSDTETLLAVIAAWGLQSAIERCVGMFAFALWDRHESKLFLVRDRMGIKPLYYGRAADGWVLGSELKALRKHPCYAAALNRNALALYFRHNYIPAPYTIYSDTWKVEPGQIVVLSKNGVKKTSWWDLEKVWRKGHEAPRNFSDEEATDSLESLLTDAVRLRMLSDVPLGAFLSGGVDSSTVVALMQSLSPNPVKTFSIGFHEAKFNEAENAKDVAAHLGTDHTELYVTSRDLLDVVPSIPQHWDEPFADSSQIPTYLLSRLTREHVTVSLSGDGGDELFSGYERYFYAERWGRVAAIPLVFRQMVKRLLRVAPPSLLKLLGKRCQKVRWRLDLLGMTEFIEFYQYLLSHFKHPCDLVLGAEELPTPLTMHGASPEEHNALMALKDLQMYLPEDILTKVDRASMAVALEARVPLLDHRVVEFAAMTPRIQKVRDGQGKWLLRQVLYRHVPMGLVDRPKMGFGVPVHLWLRDDLKEWAGDLLAPSVIRRQGYLDADLVEQVWREHLSGKANWGYYLWDLLMFQAWLEAWS
ncbi:asparagine synthase (glutamine-hydrolyzing) [Pseudodesulfovibrio cashew]|uniref:asparagine synthase (glutamine-hydrolyzing) n=1 Tax=Pseudodesulfovibrio cashew TaxID=2678688 RepID=A0A6I6JG31_9BACT|nr:asparagine synthase (glutamine-hydrolyzing) [Pseudodesulfovibrio cashew]QGY38997.1 asparagine synthase (glutamine-hydrolyzing) [Pseudodesulfovibrio cashew]